jgi:4-diphosphocytidyl-2-C-methyl-D-erythritol kinase
VQIRFRANRAVYLAPAKINLFFEVLNRRSDGFHEIETLMAPITLLDTLTLEDDPSGRVTLAVSWATGLTKQQFQIAPRAGATDEFEILPEGDANIVVRAVRLLAVAAGIDRGAKLRLIKRIPSAAGLGGGSSDAAATLKAANRVWNLRWPRERLAELASQLGSDVPFFLGDGPAICRGRGEQIEPVAIPAGLHLVVVRPPEGLSTAAVYAACQPAASPRSVVPVASAIECRDWRAIERLAHNQLLPAARKLSPRVDRLVERLEQENCPLVGMSGSGTSCFAVARSARHAARIARNLHAERWGRVWTARCL